MPKWIRDAQDSEVVSTQEAWNRLNSLVGEKVAVTWMAPDWENEFDPAIRVEGVLEIGAGGARVLIDLNTYAYFYAENVKAVVKRPSTGTWTVTIG